MKLIDLILASGGTSVFAASLSNTALPIITAGVLQKGQFLLASLGAWSGIVNSYTVQWFRNGIAIAGATDLLYRLALEDTGSVITVRVVATNGSGSATAFSIATAEIALPVGAKTVSGVSLGSVAAGATITGSTGVSTYFAIDGAGKITVTAAGDAADLGGGTYDVPLTGSGLVSGKLKFTVEANTYDCDTAAGLTAALDAAATASLSIDWKFALSDDFIATTPLTFNKIFTGTMSHPNLGKGSTEANANYASVDRNAKATMANGSATVFARTNGLPRFEAKVSISGGVNFLFDGIKFRNKPTVDVYDGKFNEVITRMKWKPALSGGVVTGVGSIQQNGVGYLASVNQRKAFIATKTGPDVQISLSNPAVVTHTGHGLAAGQVIQFKTTGGLPSSILKSDSVTNNNYYVKTVIDADNYTIAATSGGTAISTAGLTQYGQAFVTGPGSGFAGYFDVNDDGTIDANSPLVITNGGSGYDATTQFSNPLLYETTQLANCQSDVSGLTTTAIQLQVTASGGVLPRFILQNCYFGAGQSGGVNRVPQCIDVRNCAQAYIYDCSFENYFFGIAFWYGDDIEVSRCFSKGNANDFYREYPATSPIGAQATTGIKSRLLGNVCVAPLAIVDWSNSHADFFQPGDASDLVRSRDFTLLDNRIFWPTPLTTFSSQGFLNSYNSYEHKMCIMGNLIVISTVNGGQLPNAASKDRARVRFNTIVRYISEYNTLAATSYGQPACFEPWVSHRGAWSSATSYLYAVIVSYNGVWYQSLVNGNQNHAPDEVGSTFWRVYDKYEIDISSNILGELWYQEPTSTSSGFTRSAQDPAGGLKSVMFYNVYANDNAFVSNYTENTGAGNSLPEVFEGGSDFFGAFQGVGVGYNDYVNKVRTDSYANAKADMEAAFKPKVGTMTYGRGHAHAA